MQARDFCFWLQGLLEVGNITDLDATQVAQIKQHLALVFKHDPAMEHDGVPAIPGTSERMPSPESFKPGDNIRIVLKELDTQPPQMRRKALKTRLFC